MNRPSPIVLAIDAMGGDHGPGVTIAGLAAFHARQSVAHRYVVCGDLPGMEAALAAYPALKAHCTLQHTDVHVSMDEKPATALRKRGSGMAMTIDAVKSGAAHAAVSAGNTGALMAISKLALRMMPGVDRPALVASWPNPYGMGAVLDMGANVECSASQLVEFAIMGEAFHRAVHGTAKPRVGLLNIGSEEMKGVDSVREAAQMIRDQALDMNFIGFVEGDGISMGHADVIVTDGYTGNIALKTAEGTAKLISHFMKAAFTAGPLARLGALAALPVLKKLKERLDPSTVNGAVFLGLNGTVVKSHGGTNAKGFAAAISVASQMAQSDFAAEVARNLARVSACDPAKNPEVSA
jgi:glycerol-3-phosphate acyltransferase PlsX